MKKLLLIIAVGTVLISCQQSKNNNSQDSETANIAVEKTEGVQPELLKTLKVSDIVIPEGNKPLECRGLRLRILTAAPGAKIPIHSHENRPAILSVVSGAGMDVISYHMGDKNPEHTVRIPYAQSYAEFNTIVHHAINLSKTDTLRLITCDFLDDGSDCNGKKYPENLPILQQLKKENHPFYANNSTHVEGAEYSTPVFYVPLADIKFPEGSATLNERYLRTVKVTIEPGKSLPQQNYSNRPSYIFMLEGKLEVKREGGKSETPTKLQAANLINEQQNVSISNASATEKAVYIKMELWDPADEDIL